MEIVVPPEKVIAFLLREPGRLKFFTMFGYTLENWEQLRDDLRQIAKGSPRTFRRSSPYGRLFEMVADIKTPSGRSIKLLTGWIVLNADPQTLRFVTAYPA